MKSSRPNLLAMPSEIILQIADNLFDDYMCWKSPQLKYLRKLTFKSQDGLHLCPYIALAHSHPVFWTLLHGRLVTRADLKEASVGLECASGVQRMGGGVGGRSILGVKQPYGKLMERGERERKCVVEGLSFMSSD